LTVSTFQALSLSNFFRDDCCVNINLDPMFFRLIFS
jgi:hypothetical protein